MRTRSVLVVDRDDRLRGLILRILRRRRVSVVEFADAEAALDALPSCAGDLFAVVAHSDLATRMRRLYPHLPILMLPSRPACGLRALVRALQVLASTGRQLLPSALTSVAS